MLTNKEVHRSNEGKYITVQGARPEAVEESITQEVIGYSRRALEEGEFFKRLRQGAIALPHLKYVFGQYRFWRDQFHTWFGLCILKSGSCERADVQQELLVLAEHVVVEMKENHTKMYQDLLARLAVTADELRAWGKGDATRRYEQSFITVFGTDTRNFADAVIALSARELFAAIRNGFVTRALKETYGIDQSPWWQLHEHLEVEHFRGAIRPMIPQINHDDECGRALDVMKGEIDRHVDYWTAMLWEARERTGSADGTAVSCQ